MRHKGINVENTNLCKRGQIKRTFAFIHDEEETYCSKYIHFLLF